MVNFDAGIQAPLVLFRVLKQRSGSDSSYSMKILVSFQNCRSVEK